MNHSHLVKQEYIRAEAVDYLKHWLGLPYSWGGDDFSGFDCSGLIIEVLQAHGLIPRNKDYTAEGLRQKYAKYSPPEPHAGCLIFFIHPTRQTATHVAMAISKDFIIHSSGGGRGVKSLKEAIKQNAYIKKDSLKAEIERRSKYKVLYLDPFRSIEE